MLRDSVRADVASGSVVPRARTIRLPHEAPSAGEPPTRSGKCTPTPPLLAPHDLRHSGRPPHSLSLAPVGRSEPFRLLNDRLAALSGGHTASRLAAAARDSSTAYAYDRHWSDFADWCAANGLNPLPASADMVVAYVGSIAERGTVAAASLQPYLSTINSTHADYGFEKPATGHVLSLVRRGLARSQALARTRDTRIPLPAPDALQVLQDTLSWQPPASPVAAARFYRDRFALVLAFVFMGRQDSTTGLRTHDFGVDSRFVWLRLQEKQRKHHAERRIVRIPLSPPPAARIPSAIPQLAALASLFLNAKERLSAQPSEYVFQLPGEPPPTPHPHHRFHVWVGR